jgi:opacity protein-like surface antigen
MSATGYDFEYAKTELKYLFGVWTEIAYNEESRQVEYYYNTGEVTADPPPWPGRIAHCYSREIYLKSEAAYTKEEEARLIDFAERAVMEASV